MPLDGAAALGRPLGITIPLRDEQLNVEPPAAAGLQVFFEGGSEVACLDVSSWPQPMAFRLAWA
jgi:hypothetical protein